MFLCEAKTLYPILGQLRRRSRMKGTVKVKEVKEHTVKGVQKAIYLYNTF